MRMGMPVRTGIRPLYHWVLADFSSKYIFSTQLDEAYVI